MSLAVISVPPSAEDPAKRVIVFPSKKFLPDWAAAEAASIELRKMTRRNIIESIVLVLPWEATKEVRVVPIDLALTLALSHFVGEGNDRCVSSSNIMSQVATSLRFEIYNLRFSAPAQASSPIALRPRARADIPAPALLAVSIL